MQCFLRGRLPGSVIASKRHPNAVIILLLTAITIKSEFYKFESRKLKHKCCDIHCYSHSLHISFKYVTSVGTVNVLIFLALIITFAIMSIAWKFISTVATTYVWVSSIPTVMLTAASIDVTNTCNSKIHTILYHLHAVCG